MTYGRDPNWIRFLSRKLPWLAIPNIAIVFVGFQVFGFMLGLANPAKLQLLPLIPGLVLQGEVWRLLSFLAVPMSMSPIWVLFSLWFQYYILTSIESEWGAFKTTLYSLTSLIFTIVFAMAFDYPVMEVSNFASTLFLAAAALFPDHEIQIYFVIPVKMKVLGWLALAFFALRLFQGGWLDRLFLLTIYSNYLIFFGPSLIFRIKEWKRQREYRARWKNRV